MNDQQSTAMRELQTGLLFFIAGNVSGSPMLRLMFSLIGFVWIVGATLRALVNIVKDK